MKKCLKCNTSYENNIKYCKKCGEALVESKILENIEIGINVCKEGEFEKALGILSPIINTINEKHKQYHIVYLYKLWAQVNSNADEIGCEELNLIDKTGFSEIDETIYENLITSLGKKELAQKEYHKAISYFSLLKKSNFRENLISESHGKLGEALLENGAYNDAEKSFSNALKHVNEMGRC